MQHFYNQKNLFLIQFCYVNNFVDNTTVHLETLCLEFSLMSICSSVYCKRNLRKTYFPFQKEISLSLHCQQHKLFSKNLHRQTMQEIFCFKEQFPQLLCVLYLTSSCNRCTDVRSGTELREKGAYCAETHIDLRACMSRQHAPSTKPVLSYFPQQEVTHYSRY